VSPPRRRRAVLTVDLEDYRRQELQRQFHGAFPPHPREVERQLDRLLEIFAAVEARATFFTVGRLTAELDARAWSGIGAEHEIGCHGHDHLDVRRQGPAAFLGELRRARSALEQRLGRSVVSFRAPYFSSDGCDPWFGESLATAGFRLDSSRRFTAPPRDFRGTCALPGSGDAVLEVPLPSIGVGRKRLTVIGGTYFRLLPRAVIRALLARVEAVGFVPLVYLHPYDIDPDAGPLELPSGQGSVRRWKARAGDRLRRSGRDTVAAKLHSLAETWDFRPIESLLTDPPQP
jgi:hypothetical protein